MALFDLPPKDSAGALFGRDAELATMIRLIKEGRWSVILGPRMVGKTSLAKAATDRVGRPVVYVNLWGAKGTQGLLDAFLHGLNANRTLLSRIRGTLRRVNGLSIGPAGIALEPRVRPLRSFWEMLDAVAAEGERTVIILDEVQELASISGSLLKSLANLFNTHPKVVFVFTGSYFGILRTLLEAPPDSPMYGRPPATVRLEPFSEDASVEFLRDGFREYGMEVPAEKLRSVVERSLDGIPGWLTLFGNNAAVGKMSMDAAERFTVDEGKKVARSELSHFLEHRTPDLHWVALRAMTTEVSWVEIRSAMSTRRRSTVNENSVRNVLRALRDANLISEKDHRYRISDPMVRAYVRATARPPK